MKRITSDITEYKWSSYNEYMGNSKVVDIDFALRMLSEKRERARECFERYMREQNVDKCLEYEEKNRVMDKELQNKKSINRRN